MKVRELIAELQKLDPELPIGKVVEGPYDDAWANLLEVRVGSAEVEGYGKPADAVHLILEHFDSGY